MFIASRGAAATATSSNASRCCETLALLRSLYFLYLHRPVL